MKGNAVDCRSNNSNGRFWLAIFITFVLHGCGGGGSSPVTLTSIAITPSAPRVPLGLTQQFTATGTYSNASTADLTSKAQWTTSASSYATIGSTSGLATSVAVGPTMITATFGSVHGATTLTVTPPIIQAISISPNPALSGIGFSQPFAATGTYSNSSTANVTTMAVWASSVSAVATVNSATGVTTGVALGTANITASIGTISGSAAISIVSTGWFPTGGLLTQRAGHTATLLPSGKILVAGGSDSGGNVANVAPYNAVGSAELYDPTTGSWSATGSLAVPRFNHTATLLQNGKVLVAGGTTGTGSNIDINNDLSSAEIYDPASGIWISTGSMSTYRTGQTA
ncbi:MAG TPA: Ig-like domain-containing protein, partial [Xanthobacteraceae bacterium]